MPKTFLISHMEKLLVYFKWLVSFLKSEWTANDYPIRYREQEKDHLPRYLAQIINWWQIIGVGNTKQEALQDLSKILHKIKQYKGSLPRPGTGFPLEFASSEEVEKYWGITSRIIREVLGYNLNDVFVSDKSRLSDFSIEGGSGFYQNKILEIFGVDVSHIESENIAEISKYISDKILQE